MLEHYGLEGLDVPDTTYLIVLKNGPVYKVSDAMEHQASVLSRRFAGEMWAFGPSETDTIIGRFRVWIRAERSSGVASDLEYLWLAYRRARLLRSQGITNIVVSSYDPFRNGAMAWLLAKLLRAPYVIEVNGAYGNPENYADAPTSLVARSKRALMHWIARQAIRRSSAIKLLYKEQLTGFLPASQAPPHVVCYDLVPLGRFVELEERPEILFIGFPFKRKGVDLLINAFTRLSDDYPEWRLVLIGYDIQRDVERMTRHPLIEVLPPVSNEQIAEIIGRCAVLVLPSRSEAMGRVLLEAAAAGKARIGANVDGIYTVIDDERDGLLFDCCDDGHLEQQLRRILGDDVLRKELGAAARQRMLASFNDDVWLAKISELLAIARHHN